MTTFAQARKIRKNQIKFGKLFAILLIMMVIIISLSGCNYIRPFIYGVPPVDYEIAVKTCNNVDTQYHNILNVLQDRINNKTLETNDKDELDKIVQLYINTMEECIKGEELAKYNKFTHDNLLDIQVKSQQFFKFIHDNPV